MKNNFIDKYKYNQNIYKQFGKEKYGDILIPDTIFKAEDFFAHKQVKNKPNFQGYGMVRGNIQILNSKKFNLKILKIK